MVRVDIDNALGYVSHWVETMPFGPVARRGSEGVRAGEYQIWGD